MGRILDQLDNLSLSEKTVIVFWGDHGFHLGEHGLWRKNTLFEDSARSPLLVSIPGQTHTGVTTDSLVELVDIFPTLCDACQLPIPAGLEGITMVPVIEEPTREWKTAAFSQLTRDLNTIIIDGYSMRTEQYRYTEWGDNGDHGIELYDYFADPNETINVAQLPENEQLVEQLSEKLHAGWQAAISEIPEQLRHPIILPWDVNDDGVVDIQDLILISNSFGSDEQYNIKMDVNKDGSVNIIDLLIVALHLGESSNQSAPEISNYDLSQYTDEIEQWLTEAHRVDNSSAIFRRGIAKLEMLVKNTVPVKTVLLQNYPNPFNPETWIPYDLTEDTEVDIHIFNIKGESIRQLSLGFKTAGTYRTLERAAYWDGRNAIGEYVASGVYFCTLHAGNITATHRMTVLK